MIRKRGFRAKLHGTVPNQASWKGYTMQINFTLTDIIYLILLGLYIIITINWKITVWILKKEEEKNLKNTEFFEEK